MNKSSRIYIAGHNGLVGSAIKRRLITLGYKNILLKTRQELDLLNLSDVINFFKKESPEYVIIAAAKVGGILANRDYPADFIYQNLVIQNNLINTSYENGVKNLIFLGSSCIYPKTSNQPIKEEYLLTSSLEETNRPYAIAKISGIEMCWSYNRQYGTKYLALMPTNLYGLNDNYNLQNSHVLPALIRKIHEAKINHRRTIEVWGTGKPKREFLISDDFADAAVFLLKNIDQIDIFNDSHPPLINVGSGEDISIKELVSLISKILQFDGEFIFDHSKPDGVNRKLLDISKMKTYGWAPKIKLPQGILTVYNDYKNNL